MEEVLADLRKALEDKEAVKRYASGYRVSQEPVSELDIAVNQYKQKQEEYRRKAALFR